MKDDDGSEGLKRREGKGRCEREKKRKEKKRETRRERGLISEDTKKVPFLRNRTSRQFACFLVSS